MIGEGDVVDATAFLSPGAVPLDRRPCDVVEALRLAGAQVIDAGDLRVVE
ncbi:hypothetical protein SDC9_136949 [bioreactor metagenome]|uniref:Uncharacterized protein n=1 Tax=bioreactor metagenome TaxID=1076179 RepID=A0A645DK57_9ZZZZ